MNWSLVLVGWFVGGCNGILLGALGMPMWLILVSSAVLGMAISTGAQRCEPPREGGECERM